MEVLEDAKEADVIKRAYEFAQGWILSNEAQLTNDARSPRYGFIDELGRYYISQLDTSQCIRENFSYGK